LRTGAAHLSDEGLLPFDVFYRKFESITAKMGEEVCEMEWTPTADPDTVAALFQERCGRQDPPDF
jgi:hypothetical protein